MDQTGSVHKLVSVGKVSWTSNLTVKSGLEAEEPQSMLEKVGAKTDFALGYVIAGESEGGFKDGSECFCPWFAVDTLA